MPKPAGKVYSLHSCGLCAARLTQRITFPDQQPECISRAILILLSCGTVRVCTPAGYGIDTGHCSIILSAWQHTAKRVPFHPAQQAAAAGSCALTANILPSKWAAFLIPPGLQSTPGAFYTLPQLTDTPPLKKALGCAGKAQGASGLH